MAGFPKRAKLVRPPTEKQLAYVAGRVEGKSKAAAARAAGYAGAGRVIADLERQEFNAQVAGAFENAGVTLDTIAAKVGELMEASEEKAFVTRAGGVVYAKAAGLPDIQLKAAVTAADLLGLSSRARQAAADQGKPTGDGVNILVLAQQFEHLPDGDLEEAMQLMRVGQFENSRFARAAVVTGEAVTVDGKGT